MILSILHNNIRICNILDIPSILNFKINNKITPLLLYLIYQFTYLSFIEFEEEYKNNNYNTIQEVYLYYFNMIRSLDNFMILAYNIYTLEVIGCCVLDEIDDLRFKNIISPWLSDLIISKSYRNRGLSKLILSKFNEICITKKQSRYFLYCKKSLIKFYHKLGYKYLFTFNQNGKTKYVFNTTLIHYKQ
jgi:hypothetical protein